MAKISWTKKSLKDLRTINNYISLDSTYYAHRFILKLIECADQLAEFPKSGRIVPDKEDPAIRELIEGSYRIFYQFHTEEITILRIHNSERKIK